MSVCYAVSHIGIGGRRYRPGERLPELDDAQWKRLMELGAIRTEFAAQDAGEHPDTSAGQMEDTPVPGDEGSAQDGQPENGPDDADDAGDEDTELPEVDATDGIVEDEPEEAPAPRKRTRRTA